MSSHGRNFCPILTKLGTDLWSPKRNNEFFEGQDPINGSVTFTTFTPNSHLHDAFSMEALKHLSNVTCRLITCITVHNSNDVSGRP